MALIMMCGLPSSGKTRRAMDFASWLREQGKNVVLINEESLGLDRRKCYKDIPSEKNTRGAFKGAVDRAVAKDVYVICDYMNFVKGFRYELYCIARAASLPHCVIFCDTSADQAREWNAARGEDGYDEKTMEDLLGRLEIPSSRNRWDSPLIRLTATQPIDGAGVLQALQQKGEIKPTLATQTPPLQDTEFVFQLEKVTQEITSAILTLQNQIGAGQTVTVPRSTEKVALPPRLLSLPELRKHQRAFVKAVQMGHTPAMTSLEAAATAFVKFLNNALLQDD